MELFYKKNKKLEINKDNSMGRLVEEYKFLKKQECVPEEYNQFQNFV